MSHFDITLRERKKAFTILEVMMAAAVMLAGVIGMIRVITTGSTMLDMSRKQTIATQIIHTEIDTLHLLDWTTVSGWSGLYKDNTSSPVMLDTLSTGSIFGYPELLTLQSVARGFQIVRVVSSVKTSMMKISFTVSWTGNTGHPYRVSSSTYFGKNGLYVTYQRS